jgi:large subunit ribosomal protein L14
MLFPGSIMPALDNSGVKLTKLIKPLGRRRIFASVGELVLVSLKAVYPLKKVKKGTLHKAVVALSPLWRFRNGAHRVKNTLWSCVMLKKDGLSPRCTRIRAPVSMELYKHFQIRALILSPKIL